MIIYSVISSIKCSFEHAFSLGQTVFIIVPCTSSSFIVVIAATDVAKVLTDLILILFWSFRLIHFWHKEWHMNVIYYEKMALCAYKCEAPKLVWTISNPINEFVYYYPIIIRYRQLLHLSHNKRQNLHNLV